jgi:hypothetical protein
VFGGCASAGGAQTPISAQTVLNAQRPQLGSQQSRPGSHRLGPHATPPSTTAFGGASSPPSAGARASPFSASAGEASYGAPSVPDSPSDSVEPTLVSPPSVVPPWASSAALLVASPGPASIMSGPAGELPQDAVSATSSTEAMSAWRESTTDDQQAADQARPLWLSQDGN